MNGNFALYGLSLVCVIAWLATIVLGDPLHLLSLAAFLLFIAAILSDRDLGRDDAA